MKNHTTSLELSQRLKELGVPQESEFYWKQATSTRSEKTNFERIPTKWYVHNSRGECSAFLASELMEMMPRIIYDDKGLVLIAHEDGTYGADFDNGEKRWDRIPQEAPTPQEALGLMLEYLITNNLLKVWKTI
jgi:hypothetical protein